MSEFLDRFHRVLVHEIRKSRPEYLEARFTVAEIYQNLVPYRTHRDAIGVEMNGDYEATLLRLLSGEGDYLFIESEVARREIKEELQSSNPNTGLFRDFAAADVRLTGAHRDVPEEEGAPEAPAPPVAAPASGTDQAGTADLADLLAAAVEHADDAPEDITNFAPDATDEATENTVTYDDAIHDFMDGGADAVVDDDIEEEESPVDDAESEPVEASGTDAVETSDESDSAEGDSPEGDSEVCHWCRADLPERSVVNFCPFCGSDLRLTPCGECGEELQAGWRFCPGCGTESGD